MNESSRQFVKITGGVNLGEGLDIKDAQRYLNQMQSIFKNLSDEGAALTGALRKTKEKIERDFYVNAGQSSNALKAMEAVKRANIYTNKNEETIKPVYYSSATENVDMVSFRRKMEETNRRKLQDMKAFVARSGGQMTPDTEAGYYNFSLPNTPYMSDTGKATTLPNYVRNKITRQNKYVHETAKVSAADAERQEYADEYEAAQARINELHMKNNVKARAVSETKPPKPPKEGSEEDEEGSGKSMKAMKSMAVFMLIYKAIMMILDVVKDIYERALAAAGKAYDAVRTGLPLGLSAQTVLNYQYGAAAKGLEPDSITNAIGSVNSKFGNITALDNEALKKLAVVLGPNVEDLVKTGIGGKNPEQLLNMILKGFVDKAASGQNSVGMNVGVNKAIIELTEYLRKIDPNWSNIFSRMMVDYVSPNVSKEVRESVRTSMTSWLGSSNVNKSGASADDINNGANFKATQLEVATTWASVLDGVMLRLAATFESFINGLRPLMRLLMTPDEKLADVEQARASNENVKQAYIGYKAIADQSYGDTRGSLASSLSKTLGKTVSEKDLDFIARNFGKYGGDMDKGVTSKFDTMFKGASQEQIAQFMELLTYLEQSEGAGDKIDEATKENGKKDSGYVTGSYSALATGSRNKVYGTYEGVKNHYKTRMGWGAFGKFYKGFGDDTVANAFMWDASAKAAANASAQMQLWSVAKDAAGEKHPSKIEFKFDGQIVTAIARDSNGTEVGRSKPTQWTGDPIYFKSQDAQSKATKTIVAGQGSIAGGHNLQ